MPSLIRTRPHESAFGRFVAFLSAGLAWGAMLSLVVMMTITVVDVVGRYAFNRPLPGSNEYIYCLMGLVVFLGMGLCTYENGHVRVDVVTLLARGRTRAAMDVLAHLLSLGTAAVIVWRLWLTALDHTKHLNVTQVLRLPVWLVELVMAACSTLLLLGLAVHLASALSALFGPVKRADIAAPNDKAD